MADFQRLKVTADLDCELDGHPVQIHSTGDGTIVLSVLDWQTLIALQRSSGKRISLRTFGKHLTAIGQTLELQVAGKVVGRFGYTVKGSVLKVLGIQHTQLNLVQLLALWRQSKS